MIEFEFGNLGEGLFYQEKTGGIFAINREDIRLRDESIPPVKRLDGSALDELQTETQQKLREKREEFKILAKKFSIELSETADQEIQDIMQLDGNALDELQTEIQQKLREKREEFDWLTMGKSQRHTAPQYIR